MVLPWASEAELARAKRIAAQVPAAVVLPKCSIATLAVIIAKANIAIGVDTGLSHLAAALEPGRAFNQPSVELATGANRIAAGRAPAFLFYDGSNAYPGGEEYYNKPVADMLAAREFHNTNVFAVSADA